MPFGITGVLCAGNYVYDILVRSVELPVFGATTWVDQIGHSLGGNGANTGYALGRMGVPVRVLGALGRDDYGEFALATLGSAGVDTTHLQRLDEQTATTVVLVRADGERAFLHRPGVSRLVFCDGFRFTPELVRGFSHFHLANVFAMPGLRMHAENILRAARECGLTVSLDTGWDAAGEWLPVFGAGLASVGLMFVNEEEARVLTGASGTEQAARFLQGQGVRDVVVKLGARGCVVFEGEAPGIAIPGFAVDVVDTTGAGDTFAAGFLAALHHGLDYATAGRIANAVGALNVQRLGATAGLRSWDETLAWMG